MTESEIDAIIDPALKKISDPVTILKETIKSIPNNKLKSDYIKTHFSEILELIAKNAYSKFRTYQNRASKPIKVFFRKISGSYKNRYRWN